ncbi:MAG: DUF2341 domain-containing protein [Dechloromonas sp.]|nr:DUF2341 domain-containing protein [Dechloromonas sp.]
MAFPNGWSRRAPITIAATAEALSSFPVHLDAACFPAEALDTASANKAQATGADLRFSSDEAGTTELPCEVVRWVQDAVSGNRRANVHVKVPATSVSATSTIYVWYGNASATMPAATDANGREAVWDSGYDGVWHLSSLSAIPNSSAGVMADGTSEGSPATLVDGPTGQAIDFDGVDDAVHFGNRNTADATFEVVVRLDATTDQFILATTNFSPLNAAFGLLNIGSKPAAYFDTDGGSSYNNTFPDTANGSTAAWEYWAARNRASSGAAVTKALPATEQTHQSGVTDGTYLYSIGGHAVGSLAGLTTNNRFDPVANTWATRAALPVGRSGMAAVFLSGKIYCMGGTTDGTALSSRNDIFDITGNSWAAGAALPAGLTTGVVQGFSACTDGTYIYVSADSAFYRYDPVGDSWLALDVGYAQGTYKTLLCDGTYIYAIGGYTSGAVVHRYSIAGDAWDATQYDTAPYSAWAHAAGYVGSGEWVIGFGRPGSVEQQRKAYRYVPSTKTWTRLPDYDIPTNAAASAVISGKWYVYGAWCLGKVENYTAGHHASMDLATWTWDTKPSVMEFIRETVAISGKIVTSPIYAGNGNLYVARQTNGTTLRSAAKIGEVRRSNVTRSRGWLTTTRATLMAPTSLSTIGAAADTGLGSTLLNAAATGAAQTSGSAALAAQVAIAGVGVAVAGGSAAALASIPLAAAGIALADGTAGAQATVTITAAGLAEAAASAGLSVGVLLAGAGAAEAAGNAPLATLLFALAEGAALAQGNGPLAADIAAAAAGGSLASGSATLAGGAAGALSASGASDATGQAVLAVLVQLQATGAGQAGGTAAGQADSPNAISASGAAQALGAALPSIAVAITAAGFVQAMGAGQLVIAVDIAAAGQAVASGTAALVQPGTNHFYFVNSTVRRACAIEHATRRATTITHEVRRV